jgi:outer membrane protein assembly factor BamB
LPVALGCAPDGSREMAPVYFDDRHGTQRVFVIDECGTLTATDPATGATSTVTHAVRCGPSAPIEDLASPAVAKSRQLILAGVYGVAAYDAVTLQLLWTTCYADPQDTSAAPQSPATIAHGVIYVGRSYGASGSFLDALKLKTGRYLVHQPLAQALLTEPVVDAGHVYVITVDGVVHDYGLGPVAR